MPDPSKYLAPRTGQKVRRASAALPQTAAAAIFTITGRVLLLGIVGRVTTAIQNQANNTKLTANPSASSVASTDLCATASIANDAVGTLYGITGTFATALQKGGAIPLPALPVVLQAGTIDLDCSASNTGQVAWDLYYLPLDPGSKVVAA